MTDAEDKSGQPDISTYDRIQIAALRMFADKGVRSTSIRDIGAAADVPTSLLYHYVPSKHELVARLLTDGIQRYYDSARDALNLGHTPDEKLVGMVTAQIIMHCRNTRLAKVVNCGWKPLSGMVKTEIQVLRRQYNKLWDDVLQEGVDAAVFEVRHVTTTRVALEQMCSLSQWYSPGGHRSVEHLTGYFSDLALRMVSATRNAAPVRSRDLDSPKFSDIVTLVEEHHADNVFGRV